MICPTCKWGEVNGDMVDCTSPYRLKTYPNFFPWVEGNMNPAIVRHKPVEQCEWWEKCKAI